MRDPGEKITKTLIREFAEEALARDIKFDKFGKIMSKTQNYDQKLEQFFKDGTQVH